MSYYCTYKYTNTFNRKEDSFQDLLPRCGYPVGLLLGSRPYKSVMLYQKLTPTSCLGNYASCGTYNMKEKEFDILCIKTAFSGSHISVCLAFFSVCLLVFPGSV